MGRKARVNNGSPVDIALEKYHNEIGNRLSGVFLPPHPCAANGNSEDASQSACEAFSMLTLDLRATKHAVNKSSTLPQMGQKPNMDEFKQKQFKSTCVLGHDEDLDNSNSKFCDSAFSHSNNSSRSNSATRGENGSDSTKDKKNFMDKLRLARQIFQRKHTCARCQRRSRSCVQNKTFNINGKHYTCGQCREARKAIENLVIAGNTTKLENNVAKNSTDIILPNKPRLHLKESGYETATSCSTVASAHSNTSSPYASANRQNNKTTTKHNNLSNLKYCSNPNSTTHSLPHGNLTSNEPEIPNVNNGTPTQQVPFDNRVSSNPHNIDPSSSHNALHSSTKLNKDTASLANHSSSCPHTCSSIEQTTHNSTQIFHIMGSGNENNPRLLKQVQTRHVPDYDGYLHFETNNNINNNNAIKINPDEVSSCNSCDVISQRTTCCEGCNDNKENNKQDVNSFCSMTRDGHFDEGKSTDGIEDGDENNGIMACYVCSTSSRPCFRLPWQGGWLCEECIDGML